MKYLKKKKKSKLVPVLIVLAVVMVALIGAMLLLVSAKDPAPAPSVPKQTATRPNVTQAPAEKELAYAGGVLQTPYGDFRFPVEDEDCLMIRVSEGKPYIVSFSACLPGREELALLDLYFGSGADHSLGLLTTPEGDSVELGMTMHPVSFGESWTQEEMDQVHAMQEAANDMLAAIELAPVPADTQPAENMTIETPYCELLFPGKWEKYLQVKEEEDPYRVSFYARVGSHEQQFLFTVCFGAEEEAIGTVDGVSVGVILEDLTPDSSWTEEERNILFAMQEDMNLLLEALPLD